jgi:nickel transport protein
VSAARRCALAGAVRLLVAVAVLLGVAAPAVAHEVLHEVVHGEAVAVRARYADGEPLAYVAVEVFSPADPKVAHLKGRTDRNGWVAFVPDAPGGWRVRLVDGTGHGLDAVVEVPRRGAAAASSANSEAPSSLVFALRPALGVLLVLALFGVLFLFLRRRGARA